MVIKIKTRKSDKVAFLCMLSDFFIYHVTHWNQRIPVLTADIPVEVLGEWEVIYKIPYLKRKGFQNKRWNDLISLRRL